jgi:hypothetical protein
MSNQTTQHQCGVRGDALVTILITELRDCSGNTEDQEGSICEEEEELYFQSRLASLAALNRSF